MLLLLQEPHLTTLFDLLEMLACFKPPSPNTEKVQESPEVGSDGVTIYCCSPVHDKNDKPRPHHVEIFKISYSHVIICSKILYYCGFKT